MDSEATVLQTTSVPERAAPAPVGFSLSFAGGRGVLTLTPRRLGPFDLRAFELEIPHLAFPFDVTGGAERFKNRRCSLRHFALVLDDAALAQLVDSLSVDGTGFSELGAELATDHLVVTGRLSVGARAASFVLRAAPLVVSSDEVALCFYSCRAYGWLPVPACAIPALLGRSLAHLGVECAASALWRFRPVEALVQALLPAHGWKLPELRGAPLGQAVVARGRLVVSAGHATEPRARAELESPPLVAAVRAADRMATHAAAEAHLVAGRWLDAYETYRTSLEDDRGDPFAEERMLEIGITEVELGVEVRQLADSVLARDADDTVALLALASLADRDGAFGEAATRYASLAQQARGAGDRLEVVAAELAAARALAFVDPKEAARAYERAIARARNSWSAHRELFDLYLTQGALAPAVPVGERLLKLEHRPERRAELHRRLGAACLSLGQDLRRARLHFERALRLVPEDPAALQGMAETHVARGEPGRAAAYLSKLAEQAEQRGDRATTIRLNLRLGELWERWLGDLDNAAGRYHRVLELDPANLDARMRLAELAERRGDPGRARALYEDVAIAARSAGHRAPRELHGRAELRLGLLVLEAEGPTDVALASFEQAFELDPASRRAREALVQALAARGDWARLSSALELAVAAVRGTSEHRTVCLDAARVALAGGLGPRVARRFLEALVEERPDDRAALEVLVPLLEAASDHVSIIERLEAAAARTTEPMRRGEHLWRVASAQLGLGMDGHLVASTLERALDAHPFLHGAAQLLVRVLEQVDDDEALARALHRLALAEPSAPARAEALGRRARVLWQKLQRPGEAEAALRAALALVPRSAPMVVQLSRLLEARGRADEARDLLVTALAEATDDGTRATFHERLAEVARMLEDADLEATHLLAALERGRRTERSVQRLVAVLGQLGRTRDAAALLEEWAQGPALDESLTLRAAELWRVVGENDRAAGLYGRLVARGGHARSDALLGLEAIARERGDWLRVREVIEQRVSLAAPEQQAALVEELLAIAVRTGDAGGVEATARRLLELAPDSAVGHAALAERLEAVESYYEALHHWSALALARAGEAGARDLRRRGYGRAVALALDLEPNAVPALLEGFERDFPDESPDAVSHAASEALAAASRWNELLALRRARLTRATAAQLAELHEEIGNILHYKLGRSEEAILPFQEAMASGGEPARISASLREVFQRLGRYGDLARHDFAMAQLATDPGVAARAALASAETWRDKLGDEDAAAEVLRALLGRGDISPDEPGLLEALRRLRMAPELTRLLESSLERRPSAGDGRLAELVATLAETLGQPERAEQWCLRIAEAEPHDDAPHELRVRLRRDFRRLGGVPDALATWADAREGATRCTLLLTLADELRGLGQDARIRAVLEQAAAADPAREAPVLRLVESCTAAGDWRGVLEWQARAAALASTPALRDERLRRLAVVAVDLANDPETGARALAGLSSPTADERRELAELAVVREQTDDVLARLGDVLELDAGLLLRATRLVGARGELDAARRLLDRARALGAGETWELASALWRDAGRLEELGRWRLAAADELSGSERARARARAWLELEEAGQAPEPTLLAAALAEIEPSDGGDAARLLALALRTHCFAAAPRLAERVAAADDTPVEARLTALRLLAERALEAEDGVRAVSLVRQLRALAPASDEDLLERALVLANERSELLQLLEARLPRVRSAARAKLALRAAGIAEALSEYERALALLDEVPRAERAREWALVGEHVARLARQPAREIEALQVRLAHAADDNERAHCLRAAARLAWWDLGREREARDWLVRAHELAPVRIEGVREAAAEADARGEPEEAVRRLVEVLAVVPAHVEAGLASELGARLIALGRRDEATRVLEDAIRPTQSDAAALARLAGLAEQVERLDLAALALEVAVVHDAAYEEPFAELLARLERWDALERHHQRRAEASTGEEAALHWDLCAQLATERGHDPARALVALERAAAASPTRERLEHALSLAVAQEKHALVAALAPALLRRVGDEPETTALVLRQLANAQLALGLTSERSATLERLVAQGGGSPDEMIEVAQALDVEDASRAASLVLSALAAVGSDEGRALEARARDHWPVATRPAVALALAERWIESGQGGRAREWLEQHGVRDADRARWLVAEAAALELDGDEGALAELALREASEVTGGWAAAERISRLRRAALYFGAIGDQDREQLAWSAVLALAPEDREARRARLGYAEQRGNIDEALALYEREIEASEGEARERALLAAAELARRAGRVEATRLYWVRACELARDPGALVAQIAELDLGRGAIAEVLAALRDDRLARDAARSLAERLDERGDLAGESRAALDQWWREHEPASLRGLRATLQAARERADAEAFAVAAEDLLTGAHPLPAAESAALARELVVIAGRAGHQATVLAHASAALEGPEPEVEVLYWVVRAALGAGETVVLDHALGRAVEVRAQLVTEVSRRRGRERAEWFALLGFANEKAGDLGAAIDALEHARDAVEGELASRVTARLRELLERRGEWSRVAELDLALAEQTTDDRARAEVLCRAGRLYRDRVMDEARAESAFTAAHQSDATNREAKLALAMLLAARNQPERALPWLVEHLERAEGVTREHERAAIECMRALGRSRDALELARRRVDADATDAASIRDLAELHTELGEAAEAAEAWQRLIDLEAGRLGAGELASLDERLLESRVAAGQVGPALEVLASLRARRPGDGRLLELAAELHARRGEWGEAEAALEQLALVTGDHTARCGLFERIAASCREKTHDTTRLAATLERWVELAPTKERYEELLELLAARGEGKRLLAMGERAAAALGAEALAVVWLATLAKLHRQFTGDLDRAKQLVAAAHARAPDDEAVADLYRALAFETRDYGIFADLEERALGVAASGDDLVERHLQLAELVVRRLGEPRRAIPLLERARDLAPDDRTVRRRLADGLAMDGSTYRRALDEYRALLAGAPLDAELLRIAARLAGQLGETDRAYGLYAALLAVLPSDEEASRFVEACRRVVPPGPGRALTDADRVTYGLVHPAQLGPIEELFAPLGRFAELTRPGDLRGRGVDGGTRLDETSDVGRWLARVLVPLGAGALVPMPWPSGGYAADVELVRPAALLLGSALLESAPPRATAFLAARAAELYRTGHTLCERSSVSELESLAAALCLAVDPERAAVPGAAAASALWAQTMGELMTPELRAAMLPAVERYVASFVELDLGAWRRACLATAARTALVVACDAAQAVDALLLAQGHGGSRGRDAAAQLALLEANPELVELIRYATSDAFFAAREALGLALRRSTPG